MLHICMQPPLATGAGLTSAAGVQRSWEPSRVRERGRGAVQSE